MSEKQTRQAHREMRRQPHHSRLTRRWHQVTGGLVARMVAAIDRLKRHPNRWVRRGVGVSLIFGGVLGFLPILGVWMIPLGLVILSDERHWLRRPRRRLQVWLGYRFPWCGVPEAETGPPPARLNAGSSRSSSRSADPAPPR